MIDSDGLLSAFILDGSGGGVPLDWDAVRAWRPIGACCGFTWTAPTRRCSTGSSPRVESIVPRPNRCCESKATVRGCNEWTRRCWSRYEA